LSVTLPRSAASAERLLVYQRELLGVDQVTRLAHQHDVQAEHRSYKGVG
jgi:hypothetical protein